MKSKPIIGARIITKRALIELFIPFGSAFIPNKFEFTLSFANKLKEPPACSKIAQNITANKINNKAAIIFLFSAKVFYSFQ